TTMKQWNEIKHEFEADGSLRDIYVENIEPEAWDQFIAEIKGSNYEIDFYHGDVKLELPGSLLLIKRLQETNPTTLCIWLPEKIQINCHFFVETEIELDVSPRDIQNENAYLQLVSFQVWLSESMKKEVKLTHEGAQELVILSVFA
ncbi:hypothetical protein, partial [Shewanella scandinavica]